MRSIVIGVVTATLITSCTGSSADESRAADSVSHETMTAAQHSTMHGPADTTLTDSAFAELQKRGAVVMGVDQYQSAHRFEVTPDGGRIELQRIGNDSLDVAQIRAHMRDIRKSFLAGDFAKPFEVHDREMPGTAVMTRKKSAINYIYGELPRGAELRLVTTDPEAKAAIAAFLNAQRSEHRSDGTDASSH